MGIGMETGTEMGTEMIGMGPGVLCRTVVPCCARGGHRR